jgi:hypothetical protein
MFTHFNGTSTAEVGSKQIPTPQAPVLAHGRRARVDWPALGLRIAVVAFGAAAPAALFFCAWLALPLAGTAWLCWGAREARASWRCQQGWRARLRACGRFCGVATTGGMLLAGIVAPACWALGVALLAVHCLLALSPKPAAPALVEQLERQSATIRQGPPAHPAADAGRGEAPTAGTDLAE